MADLDDAAGVDRSCGHADGLIVIADDAQQFVASVLELGKELLHHLEVLGWSQEADGNVVCCVINAVDEGNFLLVALHRHILPIDHEEAAEAFGIAVGEGDLVVMRQGIQFGHECSVGRINALFDPCRERAGAGALKV